MGYTAYGWTAFGFLAILHTNSPVCYETLEITGIRCCSMVPPCRMLYVIFCSNLFVFDQPGENEGGELSKTKGLNTLICTPAFTPPELFGASTTVRCMGCCCGGGGPVFVMLLVVV